MPDEMRHIEEALQRAHAALADLEEWWARTPFMVMIVVKGGLIVKASEAFKKYTGHGAKDLENRNLYEFAHSDDHTKLRLEGELMQSDHRASMRGTRWRLRTSDGPYVWVTGYATPFYVDRVYCLLKYGGSVSP
jgi:PAS domain S-box-containing protein